MKYLFGVLIILCLVSTIYAQEITESSIDNKPEMLLSVPTKISYQGVLTDNTGNPQNGTFQMTFGLYGSVSAGTPCWDETQSVTVTNGIFNVLLGSNDPITTCAFDVPYWLGITVSGEPITQRIELSASAYSFRTKSVEDGSIVNSSIASGQVVKGINNLKDNVTLSAGSNVTIGTSGNTITISSTSTGGNGTVTQVNTGSGLTGGPINITGTISIDNSGVTNSHLANNSVSESKIQNNAVTNGKLENNSVTDSKVSFPFSKTTSSGGIAFSIINNGSGVGISGIGISRGVWGETSSSTGRGIYGLATSTSGSNYGVYGRSSSNIGTGIYGTGFFGIFGQSNSGTAIYGQRTGGGNYAGYFEGNTHVVGTLSATNKTFIIDHPLDPENQILRHSCIESPDMLNVYNGNISTDASGYAVVQLPNYFEALNKEFRYQLTVIGQFAQVIVFQEIQNNHFTIQSDKPYVKVSWQVIGIRKDPWTEKNPILVEELKSVETRGYYLNPEAYNQPRSRSVEWILHPEMMKQIEEKSGEEQIK